MGEIPPRVRDPREAIRVTTVRDASNRQRREGERGT